jgi:hypothetical protein
MEITLFKSHELDRSRWDEFILSSPQGYIYGLSDYLDIISPEWEAFVFHHDNRWLAVMPWFPKTKFGIKYVYQPVLCQFQGIYLSESVDSFTDQRAFALLAAETIQQNCQVFHCNFSGNFNYPFPFIWKGFSVQPMVNFRLPIKDEAALTKSFNHGNLEKIKKAERLKLSFRMTNSIEDCIELFKRHKGAELTFFKESNYDQLRTIYEVFKEKDMAFLTECCTSKGDLLAALMILRYKGTLIQLFAAVSDEGKKCGAMNYLIFKTMELGIRNGAEVYDFEGSMIESLESFFRSFGARPQTYWKVRRSPVTTILKTLF